jgi:predicted GTPase
MARRRRRKEQVLRGAIVALALLLPTLSLLPLGSLWLWERGLLLYWALAACAATLAAFGFQRWLLRPAPRAERPIAATSSAADPSWSPAEQAAWTAVLEIAGGIRAEDLASRDSALALGQRTVEAVARKLHPDVEEPLLRFTVPEALALVEQVSRRMRPLIADSIPLGDQLTVAQVMKLYHWRSAIDIATRAYDLWRIVRLFNPLSAATHELREQFSKKMYELGKDALARRLGRVYVREVGRAALDLYGGRLRVTAEVLEAHVSEATQADRGEMAARRPEPLRLLVLGQTSVGKSSLVNALLRETRALVDALPATGEFTPYELTQNGLDRALLIDTPGLGAGADLDSILNEAMDADLVLWVCSAARADREADRLALQAFRERFDARLDRRRPPVLPVLTHIDRLRPFKEWAPPYDLRNPTTEKAQAIKAAMAVVAADLGFGVDDVVPVALSGPAEAYNIDALWARIADVLPAAEQAKLHRSRSDASRRWDWYRVLKQAGNAGRVLTRTLTN